MKLIFVDWSVGRSVCHNFLKGRGSYNSIARSEHLPYSLIHWLALIPKTMDSSSTPLIHSSMSSTHYCWPVMNMVVIKGHSGIARKKGLRPFSSYLPATTQRQFCRQWVPSKICNNIKKGAPKSARQDNCFLGRTDGQRNL